MLTISFSDEFSAGEEGEKTAGKISFAAVGEKRDKKKEKVGWTPLKHDELASAVRIVLPVHNHKISTFASIRGVYTKHRNRLLGIFTTFVLNRSPLSAIMIASINHTLIA